MPFVVTCSVDIKIAVAHVVTQPFFSTAKDMSAFLVERKKKKRTISVLYYIASFCNYLHFNAYEK